MRRNVHPPVPGRYGVASSLLHAYPPARELVCVPHTMVVPLFDAVMEGWCQRRAPESYMPESGGNASLCVSCGLNQPPSN